MGAGHVARGRLDRACDGRGHLAAERVLHANLSTALVQATRMVESPGTITRKAEVGWRAFELRITGALIIAAILWVIWDSTRTR